MESLTSGIQLIGGDTHELRLAHQGRPHLSMERMGNSKCCLSKLCFFMYEGSWEIYK